MKLLMASNHAEYLLNSKHNRLSHNESTFSELAKELRTIFPWSNTICCTTTQRGYRVMATKPHHMGNIQFQLTCDTSHARTTSYARHKYRTGYACKGRLEKFIWVVICPYCVEMSDAVVQLETSIAKHCLGAKIVVFACL